MSSKYTTALVVALLALGTPALGAIGAPPVQEDGGDSVTANQVEAEEVSLQNVTVTDAVVRNLTVREMDGEQNVTVENVTVRELTVERASLTNVVFENVTIGNGEELATDFGLTYAQDEAANQSIQTLSIQNRTLDGVVFGNVTVDDAAGLNVSAVDTDADVTTNASDAVLVAENVTAGSIETVEVSVGNQSDG